MADKGPNDNLDAQPEQGAEPQPPAGQGDLPPIQEVADKAAAVSENQGNPSKVQESISNVKDKIKDFFSSNSGSIIITLVVGTAIALITAYVLYWILNKTVNNRKSYLMPETKIPLIGTDVTKVNADGIPNAGNGKRSTICFWVYVYDINKYAGARRHIMHRGLEADKYDLGSPYIYLNPDNNKLHVTFSVNSTDPVDIWGSKLAAAAFNQDNTTNKALYPAGAATGNSTSGAYLNPDVGVELTTIPAAGTTAAANDDDKADYLNKIHGITLDYLPLQRWVHVGIVVNEELNGGSITAYIDGELAKVVDTSTVFEPIKSLTLTGSGNKVNFSQGKYKNYLTPKFDITKVDLDRKGNYYIGGSLGSQIGPGFSGLVSKVEVFNYDLNAQDVYNNYLKGPIDNLLARLGLPPYGVRSPIYPLT